MGIRDSRRTKYQEITEAREVLGLPETATLASIKTRFRALLTRWHPDRCQKDRERCAEMTRRIIAAYQTIMDYCKHYRYSFSEETVRRHLTPEQWWLERFGEDPVWGKTQK